MEGERLQEPEDTRRRREVSDMTTQAIEHYLSLLDDAFAGSDWHSLLSNLTTVAPEDWTWMPLGGVRSMQT